MLTIKVPFRDAEKVKTELMKKKIFDNRYSFSKDKSNIYFPIKKKVDLGYDIVEKDLAEYKDKKTFKDVLSELLSDDELSLVKTAFDSVGEIAILEIDEDLRKKEKKIAQALLDTNPNITTVLRKEGSHGGTFRTQKMKYLAGEKTKIAHHKENGVTLSFNVEEVYFSVRLSTERKRISKLVKKGENVLVMFCGAAPYPCVLGKNTEANSIYGIELNPKGHKFGLGNVKQNKLTNVTLINGDANKAEEELAKVGFTDKFDRILMPLPKSAEEFLDSALKVAKKNTIIHFYDFLHVNNFHEAHEKIDKACKSAGLKYKIIHTIKCGQHSPKVYRICVDFKIL